MHPIGPSNRKLVEQLEHRFIIVVFDICCFIQFPQGIDFVMDSSAARNRDLERYIAMEPPAISFRLELMHSSGPYLLIILR